MYENGIFFFLYEPFNCPSTFMIHSQVIILFYLSCIPSARKCSSPLRSYGKVPYFHYRRIREIVCDNCNFNIFLSFRNFPNLVTNTSWQTNITKELNKKNDTTWKGEKKICYRQRWNKFKIINCKWIPKENITKINFLISSSTVYSLRLIGHWW